jgi:hypothetical protein
MSTVTTTARILGTAYGYTRHIARQIDWQEVGAIVLHGLQVLIAMTLLAGQYARRAWDSLLLFSERMGKAYSWLLLGDQPAPAPAVIQLDTLSVPALRTLVRQWQLPTVSATGRRMCLTSRSDLYAILLAA